MVLMQVRGRKQEHSRATLLTKRYHPENAGGMSPLHVPTGAHGCIAQLRFVCAVVVHFCSTGEKSAIQIRCTLPFKKEVFALQSMPPMLFALFSKLVHSACHRCKAAIESFAATFAWPTVTVGVFA
eukprot:gnl/TRDRNA2_/TRDRNA2_175358_c9_seq1.p1 gnl/TRDRNA2_/TRDRNA2_175358_c9~~gnl/TRDRNA2_/TRDRNA2_175358_c9_seq1.p1  ORF type:complete len:126 (+),score=17.63 gnl/TRDRNA2_/TRDRNA2_175358_c9_seq1:258-635(+)